MFMNISHHYNLKYKPIVFLLVLLFPYHIMRGQNHVVVSKKDLRLYVVTNKLDTVFYAPISVGRNIGDKRIEGDCKTPEGTFRIQQIQESALWSHDFDDGAGPRKGAYGPYFFRLETPGFLGIGIHGTCFPKSIGSRSSEGCVRLHNNDILKLHRLVHEGDLCIILSD